MTDHGRRHPDRTPVRPDRIRCIERGFAFIPNRFLRDGFFTSLSRDELSLYLFLVLVGDRNGVSFYSYERICEVLGITLDEYLGMRTGLINKELIDFDGTRFQVLSLPARPVPAPPPRSPPGKASIAPTQPRTAESHALLQTRSVVSPPHAGLGCPR